MLPPGRSSGKSQAWSTWRIGGGNQDFGCGGGRQVRWGAVASVYRQWRQAGSHPHGIELAGAAPLLPARGVEENECRSQFNPVLACQFAPLGALDVHAAHNQFATQFFLQPIHHRFYRNTTEAVRRLDFQQQRLAGRRCRRPLPPAETPTTTPRVPLLPRPRSASGASSRRAAPRATVRQPAIVPRRLARSNG